MIYKLLSRLGIEVWKDIPEYEGIYQVSNLGRIKSFKFNRIRYLLPTIKENYYKTITLYKSSITKKKRNNIDKNKISKTRTISIWSAMAFLNFEPSTHLMVIDHIDNNRHNDCLYNLQVISHRKNLTKDKKPKSGYTGVSRNNKKQWKSQIFINGTKKYLGSYKTQIEASQAYQKELNKINNE